MNNLLSEIAINEQLKLISEEQISKQHIEYFKVTPIPSFDNLMSLSLYSNRPEILIDEGLIKTYPSSKFIEKLKEHFQLEDWQVNIITVKEMEVIMLLIPNIDYNVNEVSRLMSFYGYFLSKQKRGYIKGYDFISLRFEPKFSEDVRDVLKNEKTLYHVTPSFNKEKILKNGFSPKWKNNLFYYPNRIYFTLGNTSFEEVKKLAYVLHNTNMTKGDKSAYSIFIVNVSKINENVRFYYDPNYKNGVYTTDNIPPNVIENIIDVKF